MPTYQHFLSFLNKGLSAALFFSLAGTTVLLRVLPSHENLMLASLEKKDSAFGKQASTPASNHSPNQRTFSAYVPASKEEMPGANDGDKPNRIQHAINKFLISGSNTAAQHLAAPFAQGIQINFQDSASQPPAGWLADFGQPFGLRTSPNQGDGIYTYGWEKRADNTPVDLTKNGRHRTAPSDTLLATLVHMQGNNVNKFNGTPVEGIWEMQIANGDYDVTVSVGDGTQTDSRHTLNVEGVPAIVDFVPGAGNRFKSATMSVSVGDGLLTVDAAGGVNTKINYISIQPSTAIRPSVVQINPENGSQNVSDVASISTSILNLPNGGINNATLTSSSVYLQEEGTGAIVSAHVNGTGGGDAITLVPHSPLKLSTTYVFNITDSVKDLSGTSFMPYASTFTTGSVATGEVTGIKFTKVSLANTMGRHSTLTIGPDGKLYALTIDGVIKRFVINPNGTLQEPELLYSLQDAYGTRQQRLSVGFAFDPASTATNLIAYVTHDTYTFLNAPDWDGRITKLSGTNLQNVQDLVVNLPRSAKDHLTNSIAFGPDEAMYFTQGGTSAMGAADQTWSLRDEHLLSAAVLRLDLNKLGSILPLDVKTAEGGGNYNPYAANAPLTIYASGVRNAYDLVWHSNGELYVATNGSAAGGNTSASVQGTLRPDGTTYSGPDVPALPDVQQTQKDFLFRIKQGGYYGHPNPLRGEYVLNGGNPTASVDPAQVNAYPVGTLPDANWRGYAFDFKNNKSPDGSIEYKSNTFNGALKGRLLIVRYSQNDDIIVLTPGGANHDIVSFTEGATIEGFSGFVDPLDLTEDVRNGNIYVSEYGGDGIITLLKPDTTINHPAAPTQIISLTPLRVYDNGVVGSAGPGRLLTVQNTSAASTLTLNALALTGANPGQFTLSGVPLLPLSLAPGQSTSFQVAFTPTAPAGLKTATLTLSSNDPTTPSLAIPLRALATTGTSGSGEPSLQALLNLWELPLNAGDDNPATAVIQSTAARQKAALLGEEVSLQRFVRADPSQPVTLTPLAVFGPTGSNPVLGAGWYPAGNASGSQELFTVTNSPATNGQTVNVNLSGTLSFDPGTSAFGFYSRWPFFANRSVYSEDALNTFSGAIPHQVRVYPYKDRSGAVVPFQYIVAFEETTSALDYQDLVFVVKNAKAFTPTSLALTPVADTYVRDGNFASINFGRDTVVQARGSGTLGNSRYSYLKFQLGKSIDVLSAKLRFYGRNLDNSASIPVSVFGVDNDAWTETGLTWNNAPASLSTALGTAVVNNVAKYYEIDVTAFVQAQSQGDNIVSFMLRDTAVKNRQLSFNSRENIFYQPQLIITTSAALMPSAASLFVDNLDRFPSNTDYMASRLQTPWSRDGVTYNTNHDTLRIRLTNKGSGTLTVNQFLLSNNTNWKIVTLKGAAYDPLSQLPFTLTSGSTADVQVKFVATDQTTRVKTSLDELSILSNDDKEPYKTLYLRGLWQKEGEGTREPKVQEIINAFGYKTSTGFDANDSDQGANNKPKGDEVLSSYFVRADIAKPVAVRQMSAYHDCCNVQAESLRWYPKGTPTSLTTVVSHVSEDAQTVLPRRSRSLTYTPSEGSFNPTTPFGFKVGSQDWSDTLLNDQRKIGIRVWKAIDGKGQVIPNAYIIANDYLGTVNTNYDYNDNIYYLTNVRPELGPASTSALAATPSAVDFGEQFLQSTTSLALNLQSLGQQYGGGVQDPFITINSFLVVGQNASEFTVSAPSTSVLNPQQDATMNITFTPQTEGLKLADLLIYYNNASSPLRVPLYGIGKAASTTVSVPYRIKAGSSTDVTVNGKTFVADTPFAFGYTSTSTNASLTQISGTDEDSIYLTEQSSNGDRRAIRYEIPIANGTYWVRLHFAEIYWGAPGAGLSGGAGSRVMSIAVEDEQKLTNFDIAGEVGPAAALVKAFPVTVSDGKLNINFSPTANRPSICAIEVYQFRSGGSRIATADGHLSLREQADAGSFDKPRVYPNPLHQRFTIQFPSVYKGAILLQLTDAGGRTYDLGKAYLQAGGVNMDVDVSKQNLKPGIYFLRINSQNGKTQTIKLLLE